MAIEKEAVGYVVEDQNLKNHFLSRSGRFVKHSNRGSILGVNRAWVHDDILSKVVSGTITSEILVHPARYNPITRLTEVTGSVMSFSEFIQAV